MIKVGITGGMGSGKSYVSRIFQAMNVPVFDADSETRKLYLNRDVRQAVLHLLGDSAYHKDGTPNTTFIASKVFHDATLLKALEGLLHPLSNALFDDFITRNYRANLVMKEAAILFESGSNNGLDKVIVVKAPLEVRVERCLKRNPTLSRGEVLARMNKQWPEHVLIERADFIVENDGIWMLIPQVLRILQSLGIKV